MVQVGWTRRKIHKWFDFSSTELWPCAQRALNYFKSFSHSNENISSLIRTRCLGASLECWEGQNISSWLTEEKPGIWPLLLLWGQPRWSQQHPDVRGWDFLQCLVTELRDGEQLTESLGRSLPQAILNFVCALCFVLGLGGEKSVGIFYNAGLPAPLNPASLLCARFQVPRCQWPPGIPPPLVRAQFVWIVTVQHPRTVQAGKDLGDDQVLLLIQHCCVHQLHIHLVFENFQVWWFHHFPG